MQIKRFYAVSIPAAIRDIRRTLGPDALILSTRPVRNSGIVINGGPARVEVTAARERPPEREIQNGADRDPASAPELGARSRRAAPERDDEASSGPAGTRRNRGPQVRAIENPATNRIASPKTARPIAGNGSPPGKNGGSETPRPATHELSHLRPTASASLRSALAELKALRDHLEGTDGTRHARTAPTDRRAPIRTPPRPRPNPYFTSLAFDWLDEELSTPNRGVDDPNESIPARLLQGQLRTQGVEEALIGRILERMYFQGFTTHPLEWSSLDAVVESSETQVLENVTRRDLSGVIGDLTPPLDGVSRRLPGEPYRIALVGPTGVGKTTTIAKIASLASLRRNLRVALVTLDTLRIAAADQLQTYAKLLGVPIEVVSDPSRLGAAFDRFADTDLILIDTPGYSPRDTEAIARLGRALDVPSSGVEVHLVLTATQRGEEMRRAIEGFRPTGFDRLLFSKMDEACSWGDLLNTWVLAGYGVSYFATGQRVPEDLETATVDGLCRRLVNSSEREESRGTCRERA